MDIYQFIIILIVILIFCILLFFDYSLTDNIKEVNIDETKFNYFNLPIRRLNDNRTGINSFSKNKRPREEMRERETMRTRRRRRSIYKKDTSSNNYYKEESREKIPWKCPICNELPVDNIAISGGKIRISKHTITEVLNTKCKNGHIWHFTWNCPSNGILGIYCQDAHIKACIRQLCFDKYIIKPAVNSSTMDICPTCNNKAVERIYYCPNQDSRCTNGHYWYNNLTDILSKDNVCPCCYGKRKWYKIPIDDFPWEQFKSDEEINSKFQILPSIESVCPECNYLLVNKINCTGQCISCKNTHFWHREGNNYRKGLCPSCKYNRWRSFHIENLITPHVIDGVKEGQCPLTTS